MTFFGNLDRAENVIDYATGQEMPADKLTLSPRNLADPEARVALRS